MLGVEPDSVPRLPWLLWLPRRLMRGPFDDEPRRCGPGSLSWSAMLNSILRDSSASLPVVGAAGRRVCESGFTHARRNVHALRGSEHAPPLSCIMTRWLCSAAMATSASRLNEKRTKPHPLGRPCASAAEAREAREPRHMCARVSRGQRRACAEPAAHRAAAGCYGLAKRTCEHLAVQDCAVRGADSPQIIRAHPRVQVRDKHVAASAALRPRPGVRNLGQRGNSKHVSTRPAQVTQDATRGTVSKSSTRAREHAP